MLHSSPSAPPGRSTRALTEWRRVAHVAERSRGPAGVGGGLVRRPIPVVGGGHLRAGGGHHLLRLALRPAHVLARPLLRRRHSGRGRLRAATATPSSPTAPINSPASRSLAACSAARRAADPCAIVRTLPIRRG